MHILTIRFNSSPKTYQYLLDSKSKLIPKAGSTLKRIRGTSYGRECYTEMHVENVQAVEYLPAIVTSSIVIYDRDLKCEARTLPLTIINSLRKTEEVIPIVKDTSPKKVLSNKEILDAVYGVLIKQFVHKN